MIYSEISHTFFNDRIRSVNMNKERIDRMNERLKDSKPALDTERARLVTEAYEKYANCTPVIRRAKAFA